MIFKKVRKSKRNWRRWFLRLYYREGFFRVAGATTQKGRFLQYFFYHRALYHAYRRGVSEAKKQYRQFQT